MRIILCDSINIIPFSGGKIECQCPEVPGQEGAGGEGKGARQTATTQESPRAKIRQG